MNAAVVSQDLSFVVNSQRFTWKIPFCSVTSFTQFRISSTTHTLPWLHFTVEMLFFRSYASPFIFAKMQHVFGQRSLWLSHCFWPNDMLPQYVIFFSILGSNLEVSLQQKWSFFWSATSYSISVQGSSGCPIFCRHLNSRQLNHLLVSW